LGAPNIGASQIPSRALGAKGGLRNSVNETLAIVYEVAYETGPSR
jgi:hypothetical protein